MAQAVGSFWVQFCCLSDLLGHQAFSNKNESLNILFLIFSGFLSSFTIVKPININVTMCQELEKIHKCGCRRLILKK